MLKSQQTEIQRWFSLDNIASVTAVTTVVCMIMTPYCIYKSAARATKLLTTLRKTNMETVYYQVNMR